MIVSGGSAADAAIAATLVLGVVEPMNAGLGGDLFAMMYDHQADKVSGIIAAGQSPQSQTLADIKMKARKQKKGLTDDGFDIPRRGVLPITTPGMLRGLCLLHEKHGKMDWKKLVMPAVNLAFDGVNVSHHTALNFHHVYRVAEELSDVASSTRVQVCRVILTYESC